MNYTSIKTLRTKKKKRERKKESQNLHWNLILNWILYSPEATFTEKTQTSWRGEFRPQFSLSSGKYHIFKQENRSSSITWCFLAQTIPQPGILPNSPQGTLGVEGRGVRERTQSQISEWGRGTEEKAQKGNMWNTGREPSRCLLEV